MSDPHTNMHLIFIKRFLFKGFATQCHMVSDTFLSSNQKHIVFPLTPHLALPSAAPNLPMGVFGFTRGSGSLSAVWTLRWFRASFLGASVFNTEGQWANMKHAWKPKQPEANGCSNLYIYIHIYTVFCMKRYVCVYIYIYIHIKSGCLETCICLVVWISR